MPSPPSCPASPASAQSLATLAPVRKPPNIPSQLESFLLSELKDLDRTITDIEIELEQLEGAEENNATPKKRNRLLSVSS
jgi:hypothetical protein